MPQPIIMPLAEVVDRHTIARLKLERSVAGSTTELQRQVNYYFAGLDTTDSVLMGLVASLYEINGRLWDQEDMIHRVGAPDEEVARRARMIRSINLERIAVKNQIVKHTADGFRDDKQYFTEPQLPTSAARG